MNRTGTIVLVGLALLLAACGRYGVPSAKATTTPWVHPASSLAVTTLLPQPDLAAAHLTDVGTLVTPFHLDATDQGRTITLIGAYADPARTVIFFRGTQGLWLNSIDIEDDAGLINAGGSGTRTAAPGDTVYALDGGPHPAAGGVAHLRVKIRYVESVPATSGMHHMQGNWSYAIALPIQPATALAAPATFALGHWKLTIEVLKVTPSVIHMQALINGASIIQVSGPSVPTMVTLLDPAGRPIDATAAGASITVPKLQINPTTYQNSRVNYQWPRSAEAGTYHLHFQGGGGTYTIPLAISQLQVPG